MTEPTRVPEQPRSRATDTIEPDRYELREEPAYSFRVSRRAFLGAAGAGVVVLVVVRRPVVSAELPEASLEREARQQDVDRVGAWLHVAEDGAVTAYTGKVEVGQDIRTSLAQAVADELYMAPAAVRLVMGDTDLTPYDAGTFGSRSTPQMGTQLRRAAAAARGALLALAAEAWGVDASGLRLEDGRVRDGGGRSIGIGDLTRGSRLVHTIRGDLPLQPPAAWRSAGTSPGKAAGRDMVTGRHRYTADMRLPGMLIGRVLRPPAAGATLLSVDTAAAAAVPGAVVVSDAGFIGVAASDDAAASRALALLRAEWQPPPQQPSHRELFDHLARTARTARPTDTGSLERGLAEADVRLETRYTTAYIAHVPLEPRAALARWDDDGTLTVWTGTQRPFGVRSELARAFSMPEARVRVLVPDTGSAYGGKHTGEAAIEAARLARAAARPVRLVWSREEEFEWAYFRPAALIEIRSGVRRDGTLTAWEFHNYNAGTAGLRNSYHVPHQRTAFHQADTPLRQGSYRALAATANTFARESHLDELAARIGMDPLEVRRRNLRDDRLRAVLDAAAERLGWAAITKAPGRGAGIACGTEKGGYVATAVEVAADTATGRVEVTRIVTAFECGAIVNPDGLRSQVEGSLVMGLGGALWEAIEFEDGRVLNPRLSQYRVPRLSDVPPIDIVLLDRPDLPSAGAGETPIIALAPAIAGAIHAATGTRLRSLPLVPHGLKG